MEKQYAQALKRLIAGGMDETVAFDKLVAHLKTVGRMKLLPLLLRELKTQQAREGSARTSLEAATEAEVAEAERAAKAEGIDVKATINPDLIRGWRLRTNGTLIDRSGKRALIDLYARITG